jgi:hypothetical protein
MKFTEEDKAKLVEFLNMNAKHAKFELDTLQLVNYYKLLQYMQGKILPKMDANILEVKRVVEAQPEQTKAKPETKKGKK